MIRVGVFSALALICFTLAGLEAFAARYWRRRLGHWLGYRIAGVLFFGALGALFAGAAIS